MKEVTHYRLIEEASACKLQKEVQTALDEGWQLYGSPHLAMNSTLEWSCIQAVVFYRD